MASTKPTALVCWFVRIWWPHTPLKITFTLNKGLCSYYACRTEILLGSRSRLTFSGGPMTTIRDTCLRMFRSIMTVSYKFSDLFTYQKPSALSTPVLLMNKYRLYNFIIFSFNNKRDEEERWWSNWSKENAPQWNDGPWHCDGEEKSQVTWSN